MHRLTSPRRSFLDDTDLDGAFKNLYLQTSLGPVEIELFGARCRVISLEDLIRAKEALGREKDRLAVKELRAIAEKRQRE